MKRILLKILFEAYRVPNRFIRKQIERIVVRIDGGYYWSTTIRKIYRVYHDITIGKGSYGCFDINRFPPGTVIGNYCSIAAETRYLNANHPIEFVTTHPIFCNSDLGEVEKDKIVRHKLKIGNDVWIGYGTTILCGCTEIGNGVVIGAGSVVTKNLEAYKIYGGVPAKKIKDRFPENIAIELEECRWYEKDIDELLEYKEEISNPALFLERLKEK